MRRILIAFLLIQTALSYGQEESTKEDVGSIATDRPVQSETPFTVPKKHLQFEMGINYDEGVLGNTELTSYPNLLVKYGLLKDLELRLTTNYLNAKDVVTDVTTSGFDNPIIGAKYKILHEDESGINLVTSLSSKIDAWAEEVFAINESNILGRITASKTIIGSWYVIAGGEYGYYNKSDDVAFYVVQTGTSLANNLTGVIEVYGYFNNEFTQSAINGALVYLIADAHQVDLSGGYGFGDNFYHYYVSVGYSFRIGF